MTSTSLPTHDALVGLFAAGDEAFGCAPEYGLGQLARIAATGQCRFRYEEGRLVGAALVDGSQLLLAVAPAIGNRHETANELLDQMTQAAGGLTCWVPEGDVEIGRSLVDAGFESEYVDIQMRRETAAASPPADLPTGLTARALSGPRDREMHRDAHDLICAAWGVDPHFDQFLDRFVRVDHYDPRLWQLVYDHEGPVGLVAGRVEHLPDATVGMVIHLDVAPHARRRGLGQVLLERICQRFSELGLSTAQLGVHDDNVSGAPALYRSLGWVEISRRRKLSRPAS